MFVKLTFQRSHFERSRRFLRLITSHAINCNWCFKANFSLMRFLPKPKSPLRNEKGK